MIAMSHRKSCASSFISPACKNASTERLRRQRRNAPRQLFKFRSHPWIVGEKASPLVLASCDELVEILDGHAGPVARRPQIDGIEHRNADLLVEVNCILP